MIDILRKFKNDFSGKNATVMGLGLLGRGIKDVRFLHECGVNLTVTDLKTEKELESSLDKLKDLKNIRYILGKHDEEDFKNTDFILKSAAVPKNSKYITIAKENNIPIYMDESLFAKYSPALTIGITGTRGKTTTTEMIIKMLKDCGKKVLSGGNLLDIATLPLLKEVSYSHLVVLELSSWQLQGWNDEKISPNYAVFTSIYPDHLNYYKDMDEYIDDKKNIFRFQKKNDYILLNAEQEEVKNLYKETNSNVIFFASTDIPNEIKLNLLGDFNRTNASAVYRLGLVLGLNERDILKSISSFKGIEHRLQLVRRLNGISFINDTTSTTPISTIKALNAIKGKIHLICGGSDKKLDVKELAEKIEIEKDRLEIYLLDGTGTPYLIDHFNQLDSSSYKIFKDLKGAVDNAYNFAKYNETILLSPGFASFGMFKNEYDRGNKFIDICNSL